MTSPAQRTGFGTAYLLSLLVAPFTMAFSGWALSIVWAWFVSPIFGVPRLSVLQAIGLGMVASYLTRDVPPDSDRDPLEMVLTNTFVVILRGLSLLAFGGVVYLLMGGAA